MKKCVICGNKHEGELDYCLECIDALDFRAREDELIDNEVDTFGGDDQYEM